MAKIATFGVEFDQAQARDLLCENNPEHVRKLWTQRRKQNSTQNERLREIAAKSQLDILELVLLATAIKSYFKAVGTVYWKTETGQENHNIAIAPNGNVIVATSDAVQALNGSNGDELWEYRTDFHSFGPFPAIGGDVTIYVASNKSLFALDGETGKRLWKVEAYIRNYPAIGSNGTVYANSEFSGICASDGQTGTLMWKSDSRCAYETSPAIAADGTVYLAGTRYVFAYNGQTGKKLWVNEIELHGLFSDNSPAIGDDGTIYLRSENRTVCALDGRSGKKLWEFKAKGEINTPPVIGLHGTLYMGTDKGGFYALNGQTGEKLWEFKAKGEECSDYKSPVVGDDGTVYWRGYRILYALDGQTGEILWEFKLEKKECIDSDPVMGPDGTIYLCSCLRVSANDNDIPKIYAIYSGSCGLANSPWPMRGQNAQRTGCLAEPNRDTANQDKPVMSEGLKNEIKNIMAEAEIAEKMENAKWLRKKDFTRARELYAQAAALGS